MSQFPLSILKTSQPHHQPKSMNAPRSSDARGKRILIDPIDDRISKLPDDVLVMILASLSTEDALKTSVLSTRWKNVWKQVPYLHFDFLSATYESGLIAALSNSVAESITQVINNHNGHLMGCSIHHFAHHCVNGVLENWIRLLTIEKNTRFLSLCNKLGKGRRTNVLRFSPNTFSHPKLATLFLRRYDLVTAHAFKECENLKILKLEGILAEVDVFNTVIASCPSLKVLVLNCMWYNEKTCLKIHNNNLKVLHLDCPHVDCIDVSAALLDIFSIFYFAFAKEQNFVIKAPRLLFNNWTKDLEKVPNMNYNITSHAQEKKNIGHEFVVSGDASYLQKLKSLKVVVDVTNSREVHMLRDILVAWNGVLEELHILFKDNNVPNSKEDSESSIGGTQKKKWEEANLFPNADFRVEVMWMFDFNGSNKKQFALASRFVTQGTVMKKMMIKTSSFFANEKLDNEAVVAKLKELPKGNENLSIECF
ncbi:putative F-box protein [Arabidopsis thaliana]